MAAQDLDVVVPIGGGVRALRFMRQIQLRDSALVEGVSRGSATRRARGFSGRKKRRTGEVSHSSNCRYVQELKLTQPKVPLSAASIYVSQTRELVCLRVSSI